MSRAARECAGRPPTRHAMAERVLARICNMLSIRDTTADRLFAELDTDGAHRGPAHPCCGVRARRAGVWEPCMNLSRYISSRELRKRAKVRFLPESLR